MRRVVSYEGLWPILLLWVPRLVGSFQCTYTAMPRRAPGLHPRRDAASGGVSGAVEGGSRRLTLAASSASWSQGPSSGGRSVRGRRREEERAWETDFFARLADNGKQLISEQQRRVRMDVEARAARQRSRGAADVAVAAGEEADEDEEEDDMITSLFKGPSVGSKRQHRRFQVSLRKPLGLFLAQSNDGLVISKVVPGGHAEAVGLKVGDRILATSATMGTRMWSQRTLDGVHAAISSRLAVSDNVTFDVERLLDGNGEDSISSRAVEVYEVELEKPLALELMQEGPEGGVYVKRVTRSDSEALRQIQPYDRVVAVSASLGDQLWRTNSLEGLERSPEMGRLVSSMGKRKEAGGAGESSSSSGRSNEMLLMGDQRIQQVRYQMAVALRERDADRAISIYKLAVERGIAMDAHSCTSLIKAYGMKNQLDKAMGVLRMMKELGIRADVVTYNTLLNACEKSGAVAQAEKIFYHELAEEQLSPDLFTYSVMMNLYGKRRRLPDASALFEEMVAKGLKPELPAYTTMIKAAVHVDDMDAALDYLRRMFDDQLEPDVKLYNTLIWGHCKRLEHGKAVRILRLMESKSVAPDLLTYSYLISCHVDCNRLDEAKALYTEMRGRLIRPNLQMYSMAIDLFAKMGDTKAAADTFKEMRSEKVQPNYVTYTSLMEAFLNAGFPSAALSISDEMIKSPGLRVDVAAYVMRIRCLAELGNIEAIEEAIREMATAKIRPNVVVYNEYMRAALRVGRLDLALRIFNTILDTPGFIPNLQTHKYLLERPIDGAPPSPAPVAAVEEEEDALPVDSSSASAMVVAPGESAMQARLAPFHYEVLRIMARHGVKPRAVLYVSFLQACLRADRLDLAAEVMEARRSNRLQVYRLYKKHLDVVLGWEERLDDAMRGSSSQSTQRSSRL